MLLIQDEEEAGFAELDDVLVFNEPLLLATRSTGATSSIGPSDCELPVVFIFSSPLDDPCFSVSVCSPDEGRVCNALMDPTLSDTFAWMILHVALEKSSTSM